MAEKKKVPLWANFLTVAVIFGGLYGCFFGGEKVPKAPEQMRVDRMDMAYVRCQNATKGRIADPEGMRFAARADWQADWSEDATAVTFIFDVVARNAFGALVPARMRCSATYDGQYWTADEISQL